MAPVEPDVLVIGAGVAGLTTATCLAEHDLSVLVRARELPTKTHSCAAGAMWGQYLVDHERVPKWSKETLEALTDLATDDNSGVTVQEGVEASRVDMDPPNWIAKLGYS